jgi:tRNA(Ile)-lysidine synthase
MGESEPVLRYNSLSGFTFMLVRRSTPPHWLKAVSNVLMPFPRDDRYLVGVSGGVDSRVLLHVLLQLGFKNLVVCHLDHNLRGTESQADAAFVRRFSERSGLAFYTQRVTEWPDDISVEAAGREARWQLFAAASKTYSANGVFLAHHADDQVETWLFNLFRGTASYSNAGMKFLTTIEIATQKLSLIRPLLSVWKSELLEFAQANHLKFREDSSNASRVYSRNRVRHELIPKIEAVFQRPVRKSVLRICAIAQDEEDFIQSHVPDIWLEKELQVKALRTLPPALQRRVIYRWLVRHEIPDVGFNDVEAIRALLTQARPAKINLPGAAFCRRKSGKLFLQFP